MIFINPQALLKSLLKLMAIALVWSAIAFPAMAQTLVIAQGEIKSFLAEETN